ncbi:MAG TPA: SAM-dependent chlorinase/fluorinase [Thermoplasmata archaeon]|nr:SAM-dependent chlorinase/fluorinase [Thermoplasmata archaeon]
MAPRRASPGALVTVSTDVGNVYAAQMKAVLYHYVAPGHVVDLAHDLPAHDVVEGAFMLRHMSAGFPHGTVHVAIVDPGVGGRRAPLAVRCSEGSVLVGPDNGLLAPLAERLGRPRAFELDPSKLRLARASISPTFEGRDLFAHAAGQIATGVRVENVGHPHRMAPLPLPEPHRSRTGFTGEILHIDRFGNLITNVPAAWIGAGARRITVQLGGQRPIRLPWARTYEELPTDSLGVLGSSFGTLEVSARESSAADRLGARRHQPVRFRPTAVK